MEGREELTGEPLATERPEIRVPLPNIVQGDGEFKFPNGDKYVGGFEAKKIDLTVTKHGYGEYTTWDGHVYKAHWINDQLDPDEDIVIEFCDNSRYQGPIVNGQYSGLGRYTFPDKSFIQCVFEENEPSADALFVDKLGFSWLGGVRNNAVRLRSLNTLYTSCAMRKDLSISDKEDKIY